MHLKHSKFLYDKIMTMVDIEYKLPVKFCSEVSAECSDYFHNSTSVNLVAMHSVGVSFFIRFLSIKNETYKFIHINSYELSDFTKEQFFEQFAKKSGQYDSDLDNLQQCRNNLGILCQKYDRIIIVINRLDRIYEIVDKTFMGNLRFLRETSLQKIVFLFVSSTPMLELGGAMHQTAANLHVSTVYFKPYSLIDLANISSIDGSPKIPDRFDDAILLSGGHHSLFHTLLRCQSIDSPLSDSMVELVIKDIYYSLNGSLRRNLQETISKNNKKPDKFLLDVGFIKYSNGIYTGFTPLLEQYIRHHRQFNLPAKEKSLLRILKKNVGKVVSKHEIIDYVWHGKIVSDWALNSLIYRLRKHQAFDSSRYQIVSLKKDGYMLIDLTK